MIVPSASSEPTLSTVTEAPTTGSFGLAEATAEGGWFGLAVATAVAMSLSLSPSLSVTVSRAS